MIFMYKTLTLGVQHENSLKKIQLLETSKTPNLIIRYMTTKLSQHFRTIKPLREPNLHLGSNPFGLQ